jgi:hypothetical protein
VKCKDHPRYAAKRKPLASVELPFGCPACWVIWEGAKAGSVNVELTVEEARHLVLALHKLVQHPPTGTGPTLLRLYQLLVQATKGVV